MPETSFDRLKEGVFLHGSLFLTSRHGLYNIFSIAPVPSYIVSEFSYIVCPVMHSHEVVNKGALPKSSLRRTQCVLLWIYPKLVSARSVFGHNPAGVKLNGIGYAVSTIKVGIPRVLFERDVCS